MNVYEHEKCHESLEEHHELDEATHRLWECPRIHQGRTKEQGVEKSVANVEKGILVVVVVPYSVYVYKWAVDQMVIFWVDAIWYRGSWVVGCHYRSSCFSAVMLFHPEKRNFLKGEIFGR